MKKILITTIITCIATLVFAQENYDKRIFEESEMVFYGYDFSHFKMADIKKFNKSKEDKSKIMDGWAMWMDKYIDQEFLEKKMNKTNITFSLSTTTSINKNVKIGR